MKSKEFKHWLAKQLNDRQSVLPMHATYLKKGTLEAILRTGIN